MRYSTYFVGLLLVFLTFIAFGGTFMYLAGQDRYNTTISDTYKDAYTNVTELQDYIEDTTNIGLDMEDESRDAKMIEGEFDDSSESELSALNLAKDSFGIVKSLFINTARILRIPSPILGVAIGAMIFILFFATISMIFRYKS